MTATTTHRPGRNDPCHCGSGRKYKQCHLQQDEAEARAARAAAAEAAAAEAAQKQAADGEAAAGEGASATPAPTHAPRKPATRQPWKKTNTHGFQRMSTPRKVGGG